MSKRIFTALILISIVTSEYGLAQEDPMRDLLIRDRSVECYTYVYNAELLIPRLHRAGELDSVSMILDYLDAACGKYSMGTYRLLRQIEADSLPDDYCDPDLLERLLRFGYPDLSNCVTFTRHIPAYNEFLREYAGKLLDKTDSSSTANLLCHYYHGETEYILNRLKSGTYKGTCFQAGYDETITELKRRLNSSKFHWSVQAGTWNPLGNAKILGPKFEFGGEIGYRAKRLGFDLSWLIRTLKSKEEYVVLENGRLSTTDRFIGSYVGASAVCQLIKPSRLGLECFAGTGYDFIDAYRDGDNSEYLNAFNINVGLNIQIFYNRERTRYFGLQTRYNMVSYYTHGGTDLTGNSISINLVYGYLGNLFAIYEARETGYFD